MIITSILEKYYGVSTLTVYWTSMIFMVTYIPLIVPASWLLDKKATYMYVHLGWLIYHLFFNSWQVEAKTGLV